MVRETTGLALIFSSSIYPLLNVVLNYKPDKEDNVWKYEAVFANLEKVYRADATTVQVDKLVSAFVDWGCGRNPTVYDEVA